MFQYPAALVSGHHQVDSFTRNSNTVEQLHKSINLELTRLKDVIQVTFIKVAA
jgi:hypothetical protein